MLGVYARARASSGECTERVERDGRKGAEKRTEREKLEEGAVERSGERRTEKKRAKGRERESERERTGSGRKTRREKGEDNPLFFAG